MHAYEAGSEVSKQWRAKKLITRNTRTQSLSKHEGAGDCNCATIRSSWHTRSPFVYESTRAFPTATVISHTCCWVLVWDGFGPAFMFRHTHQANSTCQSCSHDNHLNLQYAWSSCSSLLTFQKNGTLCCSECEFQHIVFEMIRRYLLRPLSFFFLHEQGLCKVTRDQVGNRGNRVDPKMATRSFKSLRMAL